MDGYNVTLLSIAEPSQQTKPGSGLRNSCTQMRRQWHPTPVLLPGKSHGQRSLVGCSPWDRQESDMTERLHFHFSLSCIGEGNGNTLQCSGLENPRDGGAWWAAIYGIAQSRTRLKWLSLASKDFTYSNSCIPRKNTTRPMLLISLSFYRWENWHTETLTRRSRAEFKPRQTRSFTTSLPLNEWMQKRHLGLNEGSELSQL